MIGEIEVYPNLNVIMLNYIISGMYQYVHMYRIEKDRGRKILRVRTFFTVFTSEFSRHHQ
jgi:hypothetical protein